MNKHLILLALVFVCGIARAQEEPLVISADRPGALTGPHAMPYQKVQWETGLGYESEKGGPNTFTLNTSMLRFGLFKHAEIRVSTDFLLSNDGQGNKSTFGIAPLTVGMKAQLNEGSGILPTVALLAQVQSPHIGTKDQLPPHLAPSMYFLFDHEVTNRFSIGYNIGAEWDGENAIPTTFLGLGLYFGITDRWSAFLESYNRLNARIGNSNMTEFGITWLASRRVQLDLYADLDFKRLGSYFNVACGVSWLIN